MSKRNLKINNSPLGVDDFGNNFYKCYYTNEFITIENKANYTLLAGIIPQVSGSYVCSPLALEARKLELREFNKWEKNCNTCSKFDRIPHVKKGNQEAITGRCLNHPSRPIIKVYPQDCMGMNCWKER